MVKFDVFLDTENDLVSKNEDSTRSTQLKYVDISLRKSSFERLWLSSGLSTIIHV